ncbi:MULTISPECIES: DUF4956 domain-containing protein [Paraliobacillus]|uniref:DUF4956 domain-containing protein n=1 Tax=Paraliobacillus TaxID=200903 RepID=UPI0018E5A695|nr:MULTISPECIES: DUF4956 domain-containing protein [Paraliobacillus]
MGTVNFSDILSSNFLESTQEFSLIDSLLGLITSFIIGLVIYFIYKKTFSGVIYSHSFNVSIIIMTMATALIIMGISSNVLLSLGMVGALSIVRFRTPIKDPMDLVYLFWAIVSGILCGAGFIPLVIVGTVLIGLVMIFFINRVTIENPYLLIVKYTNPTIEKGFEKIISQFATKHAVKSKSSMSNHEYEVTYEVRVKDSKTAFVNDIANMENVKSAIMLSYDGNFTA